ncbi:MAG: thioredoxin domain-containing protein [Candidatus Poribacteria bacterium]|nr:thioredoxin domain-containing protein [Candidatus Poribacteria bacterium]
MKPVVPAVALEYRDTFTFAKLDVNTQEEKTVEYRIRGTPTYIVFRDGEIVGRFIGAMPSAKLVQQILSILEIEETE